MKGGCRCSGHSWKLRKGRTKEARHPVTETGRNVVLRSCHTCCPPGAVTLVCKLSYPLGGGAVGVSLPPGEGTSQASQKARSQLPGGPTPTEAPE